MPLGVVYFNSYDEIKGYLREMRNMGFLYPSNIRFVDAVSGKTVWLQLGKRLHVYPCAPGGAPKKQKSADSRLVTEVANVFAKQMRLGPKKTKALRTTAQHVRKSVIATAGQALFNGIAGMGDYKTNIKDIVTNELFTGKSPPPLKRRIASMADGIKVQEREFVSNVVFTESGFTSVTYDIYPTNEKLFPSLSNLAAGYQEYLITGLVVTYTSTSSDNNTNAAVGTVILSYSDNPADADPSSKQEMLGSHGSVSCKPSQSMMMGIECDPNRARGGILYNESQSNPGVYTLDSTEVSETSNAIGNIQHGRFTIAIDSSAFTAGDTIGELSVTYSIWLLNRRIPHSIPGFMLVNRQVALQSAELVGTVLSPTNLPTTAQFKGTLVDDVKVGHLRNAAVTIARVNYTTASLTSWYNMMVKCAFPDAQEDDVYCINISLSCGTRTMVSDAAYYTSNPEYIEPAILNGSNRATVMAMDAGQLTWDSNAITYSTGCKPVSFQNYSTDVENSLCQMNFYITIGTDDGTDPWITVRVPAKLYDDGAGTIFTDNTLMVTATSIYRGVIGSLVPTPTPTSIETADKPINYKTNPELLFKTTHVEDLDDFETVNNGSGKRAFDEGVTGRKPPC
jgi:hypothetical protein